MSDPFAPGPEPDAPDGTGTSEHEDLAAPAPAAGPRRGPVRRLVTGRRSRWAVGGVAALVLVGGTAAVTAGVLRHDGGRVAVAVGPGGLPALKQMLVREGPDGVGAVAVKGGKVVALPGALVPGVAGVPDGTVQSAPGVDGVGAAPAPLPSLSADQAVPKAEAAVPGGKVESLASVPQQGGGSAWRAVVLGPDGVRHQVTLDGATGGVTSNTVLG